jgi:hypothetical protein
MIREHLLNEIKVEQYFPFLKKKAGKAIAAMKKAKKGMWRGILGTGLREFERKQVRTDRKPRDSAVDFSEMMDDYLQGTVGWRPRKEGMFLTGNRQEASRYGKMYLVFPVGNFKFVWSKKWKDTMEFFNTIKFNEPDKMEDAIANEMGNFSSSDLPAALKSNNEVVVQTPEYFAIAEDWLYNNHEKLKEGLGIDLKAWNEL